jgi:hypothetical protein
MVGVASERLGRVRAPMLERVLAKAPPVELG